HKADPKKPLAVSIKTPQNTGHQIENNRELIELLAVCNLKSVGDNVTEPASAAKTSTGGCEIYVEGLVDEGAEQQRMAKRRDELTKQIFAMKGRLGNEGYIAKAPPNLVQQTKDQLAAAEAELAKLG